eukprot:43183-Eustigmatos_ZCMA.PRE.1
MLADALRGWAPLFFFTVPHTSGMHMHLSQDAYYAQCEMLRDPSLRGKAFGIQQKYLIVTCSYEARKKGEQAQRGKACNTV